MRILQVSYHPYVSKNRAGFHHLARAFRMLGHEVSFVTTGPNSSLLGYLMFLPRDRDQAGAILDCIRTGLSPGNDDGVEYAASIGLSHIPNRFRALNFLFPALARISWCSAFDRSRGYDVIFVESSEALMKVRMLRERFPAARIVYRVSDDLESMGYSPYVVAEERRILPLLEFASCPSTFLVDKVKRMAPALDVRYDEHCIWKDVFDAECASPFEPGSKNAIFIGVGNLDLDTLAMAAEARPGIRFHVFGKPPRKIDAPNVAFHGMVPFRDLVPYIKHADIGLQTIFVEKNLEVFEKTLKVVQYTYCRLPIVAPARLNLDMGHVIKYAPDAGSIGQALDRALAFDRTRVDRTWISDWTQLAARLLGAP